MHDIRALLSPASPRRVGCTRGNHGSGPPSPPRQPHEAIAPEGDCSRVPFGLQFNATCVFRPRTTGHNPRGHNVQSQLPDTAKTPARRPAQSDTTNTGRN
eukprot:12799840-Alexandrium_andersonii.AAC.1